MGLITFGLERLFRRISEMHWLQVKRTLLADRLQDGGTLISDNFLISVEVDDEAGNVFNNATDGSNVAFAVLENDPNLGAGDVKTPESFAVTLDET